MMNDTTSYPAGAYRLIVCTAPNGFAERFTAQCDADFWKVVLHYESAGWKVEARWWGSWTVRCYANPDAVRAVSL